MKVSPINSNYVRERKYLSRNQESNEILLKDRSSHNLPMQEVSFGSLLSSFQKVVKSLTGYDVLVQKGGKNGAVNKAAEIFVDKIEPKILKENILTKSGNIKGFYEYRKSNAGIKNLRKVELNPDNTIKTITTYEYVPNSKYNELSRTFNFDGQGNLQWETRYKYAKDYSSKYISETEDYGPDGSFLHRTIYGWNGIKRDYDANGNVLRAVRTTSSEENDYQTLMEVIDYNPNSPYYGKVQVLDNDFNLLEIIKYESQGESSIVKEFKYYPSGKFKSEAECYISGGFSSGKPWNKREVYESGALKYIDKPGDRGYYRYYENGNLMEEQSVTSYYSGTHTYISNIDKVKYAPDGKTVILRSSSCPNDSWIPDINEREHTLEYSPDGKTVKQIYHKLFEKYGSKHEEYTVKFNDDGSISEIYIGKSFSHSTPDFKSGEDIALARENIRNIYDEYKNVNNK